MSLTGVDPNNPRPAIRREYVFGAGPTLGMAPSRPVLLFGNKTAAGTETANVIGEPIRDDADCRTRFGDRSEIYLMYRAFVSVPQEVEIYAIAVPESGGTAAATKIAVANASDANTTWTFHCLNQYFQVSVGEGDNQETTAKAIEAAFNAADDGRLPFTAVAAIDGAGPTWMVTITYSHKGLRGDLATGKAVATRGIRFLADKPNAQTLTKTEAAAGATADDFTTAILEAANGEFYYHVTPWHDIATFNATDNGWGEHLASIVAGSQPINGKDQVLFAGFVGTQAQATTIATTANSVFFRLFRQEHSDWMPGMISAHCCAITRQQEIKHPGANINGWVSSDNQVLQIPKPYLKADYPTNSEIVADLNNGVCPLSYEKGRVVLERHITSRSKNTLGNQDYRAREGHITSVMHFFWAIARQRYEAMRQPFADDDPVGNQTPPQLHTTPSAIRAMLGMLVDDLCGDAPLGGTYRGAILKPSAKESMKATIDVKHNGKGGFPTSVEIQAVQHNIKWETLLRETGNAY